MGNPGSIFILNMWVKEGQPRLGEIGPESDDENLE